MPDATAWRDIADASERLRTGLRALYGWYERNAALSACVLRDAEYHALTREIVELRQGPSMAAYGEVLGAGLDQKRRAMLGLALSFFTWRSLAREGGLETEGAVVAMALAIADKNCANKN